MQLTGGVAVDNSGGVGWLDSVVAWWLVVAGGQGTDNDGGGSDDSGELHFACWFGFDVKNVIKLSIVVEGGWLIIASCKFNE